MPTFVKNAETKIQLQAYQNMIRLNADVDSFAEQSTLSLAQARTIMKYLHNNNVKTIGIVGPEAITLHVGEYVQYKAMAYRSPDSINVATLGALADDITAVAQWLKNPVAATVTVSNGLITAAVIGVIGVYVKLGDLQSAEITVTVVA